MPPKLPRVSGEEAVRVLQRMGFVVIRQRASHLVLKRQGIMVVTCVVPLHRELAIGRLRGILGQGHKLHLKSL